MSNYGKRISIKKRLTGIVVDLKKIPLHKQENVFLRDGYYVIGHKDMYSHCNKCKKWSIPCDKGHCCGRCIHCCKEER